jgi:hypothetical protein
MIYDFKDLRPTPTYPVYPPYHKGPYLEDYIFEYYKKNRAKFDEKTNRIMIPVSWTTLYVENTKINIQEYLDALPQDQAYWTVSQHDDGIRHRLPPDTLHFAAGGLGGGIPIPLVCSPIPDYTSVLRHPEPLTVSFIGRMTHPIRQQLFDYNRYQSVTNQTYFSDPKGWSQTVDHSKLLEFINVTRRSAFALAPRGYGLSSFRLYEIMQLGSIPIYVSDKYWLPWEDELDWNEFCVLVKSDEIHGLYDRLNNISEEKRKQMLERGKEVYYNYFTLEKVAENILKRL